LDDDALQMAEVSVQSDDFWYPPFLLGVWNISLIFDSAKFVKGIPVQQLATSEALPGFRKYSVFFIPELGKDIESVLWRYVQLDGHPREDHSFNLRNLVSKLSPATIIDRAPYAYQKPRTWLLSESNRWQIDYHDENGKGEVELQTRRRSIRVFAGTVETAEFVRQIHRREENFAQSPVLTVTDYCLNWRLTVPASLKDEFVTVEDLSRTPLILGALDVYVYLQPSNNFYLERPRRPAGVFTYNVSMSRLASFDERAAVNQTQSTEYPFLWRDVGPVELQDFFGY